MHAKPFMQVTWSRSRRWLMPLRATLVRAAALATTQIAPHPWSRLGWCALGMLAGVGLALHLAGPPASPFLLASLGGSGVFLFGMTRAPAAQPRALLGGHLGCAAIGVACHQWLGESMTAYVVAESLALLWMLSTRTLHPPAGANPLLMIHAQAGWSALWSPVGISLLALMAVAFVWSRCYPGLTHYPAQAMAPSPPSMLWGGWDR